LLILAVTLAWHLISTAYFLLFVCFDFSYLIGESLNSRAVLVSTKCLQKILCCGCLCEMDVTQQKDNNGTELPRQTAAWCPDKTRRTPRFSLRRYAAAEENGQRRTRALHDVKPQCRLGRTIPKSVRALSGN
jgi:hypothetical protein